jgi:hypothetical protein
VAKLKVEDRDIETLKLLRDGKFRQASNTALRRLAKLQLVQYRSTKVYENGESRHVITDVWFTGTGKVFLESMKDWA